LIPSLRISPPASHHLAADREAPAIAWFAGDRERLQVATSAVGLGVDLSGAQARVLAGARAFRALADALAETGSPHAGRLRSYLEPVLTWTLRTRSLPLDAPLILGILNLTEDSFSGDGVGSDISGALRRAEELRTAGAVVIDVGAESARADRPVFDELAEAELASRAIAALVAEGHIVSCDTYKPAVAAAALEAGAEIVNDISGLTLGTGAAAEATRAGSGYILNYSYSVPKRRPDSPPHYEDVVTEMVGWMEQRLAELAATGLSREAIVIDPGIAFGKSHDEDLQVIRRIGELTTFGQPVLLAHSRKNFIGSINGSAPADRDLETHVASALAFEQGVRLFRVHDPAGARRALEIAAAISAARAGAFAPDGASWPWRAGASAEYMTKAAADKAAPSGQRW
jgi:dihydropteroate synthase